MKKYLISLEKDIQRRALFFNQKETSDFEIFNAINLSEAKNEHLLALFDLEKSRQYYQRKISQGEIGCTLSHLSVYDRINKDANIQEDEFCLICEDDALLAPNFASTLQQIIQTNVTADIILLGQSKISDFNHLLLELAFPTTFRFLAKKIQYSKHIYALPYKNYYAGTVCYLIRKSAVKNFIEYLSNHQLVFWLADDFALFNQLFNIRTAIIRPLLAIENPLTYSNIEGERKSMKRALIKMLCKYPFKKLIAILTNIIGGQ